MNPMLVALCSLVLVDHARGFNPVPAVPVHRAPNVQPQTGPYGAEPLHSMPSRGSAFLPPTQGSTGTFVLPPTYPASPALSATQTGQETLPTEYQPEYQEADVPTTEQVVAMKTNGDSWHEGFMGFAAGVFASLSGLTAAFLTYRSSLWQQSSPTQQRDGATPFLSDISPAPAGALLTGVTAAMLLSSPLPADAVWGGFGDDANAPSSKAAQKTGGFSNIPMFSVKSEKVVPPEGESDKDMAKRIKRENNLTKIESQPVAPPKAIVDKVVDGKLVREAGTGVEKGTFMLKMPTEIKGPSE